MRVYIFGDSNLSRFGDLSLGSVVGVAPNALQSQDQFGAVVATATSRTGGFQNNNYLGTVRFATYLILGVDAYGNISLFGPGTRPLTARQGSFMSFFTIGL
jgi:hypothetical protein